MVAGVPIYNWGSRGGHARRLGNSQSGLDWVLSMGRNASDDDVREVCTGGPAGLRGCLLRGHPSGGGVAFAGVRASESELAALLRRHASKIAFAEPDGLFTVPALVAGLNVSAEAISWGLDRISSRLGLSGSFDPLGSGEGVHVYVMDSGVQVDHPDFEGRATAAIESLDYGVVECDGMRGCAHDSNGHGTFCAGIVGGKEYGVAKEAALHAVKVLNSAGKGRFSWFLAALDWIAAHGKRPAVITASLGARGRAPSIERAIEELTNASIVVVIAAGNSAANACSFTPARAPSAITVGATDMNDQRARYSNYGPCVDIFAPGSGIISDGLEDAAVTLSGTSMSCPFVAAALLLQRGTPARDVAGTLQSRATKGLIADAGTGSPNLLLYVGSDDDEASAPALLSAECSAHAGCKHLAGDCCPTVEGFSLSCCNLTKQGDGFSGP